MVEKAQIFVFKSRKFNWSEKSIIFTYQTIFKTGRKIDFTEILHLPEQDPVNRSDVKILENILTALHIILGISYYKAFCAKKIVILENSLTTAQADFFNIVYTKGLGEFFYKNNIDFKNLVRFPSAEVRNQEPTKLSFKKRSLLALGGGKDSLVSLEILRSAKKTFAVFNLNNRAVHRFCRTNHLPELFVRRNIDPKLLQLNQQELVYNGHIPISAVYAFVSLLAAFLYDFKYLIFSNEKSASYGNVIYKNQTINHQWSKSEEFEIRMQAYIKNFITDGIEYFSLLRPMYEIEIVRRFIEKGKYFNTFISCNTNFRLRSKDSMGWCGECPKCLFVFCLFAAFLPKKDIIRIFGSDFLNNSKLTNTLKGLLGQKNYVKPFDCVGTDKEMGMALQMISKKGDFKQSFLMKLFERDFLLPQNEIQKIYREVFGLYNTDNIPDEFQNIFKQ